MNALLKYLTGKATAPLNMLIALGFAIFAFVGLPLPANETTPGTGLPEETESVVASKLREEFVLTEGSAAFIVYFADYTFCIPIRRRRIYVFYTKFDCLLEQFLMLISGANFSRSRNSVSVLKCGCSEYKF